MPPAARAVAVVHVARLQGTLQLKESKRKNMTQLKATFDTPEYKSSVWLSRDAPDDRLGELLTAFVDITELDVSDEFKAFEQTAEASIQKFDAEATKVNEEKRAKVRRFRACDWRVCLLTCLVHPHL